MIKYTHMPKVSFLIFVPVYFIENISYISKISSDFEDILID